MNFEVPSTFTPILPGLQEVVLFDFSNILHSQVFSSLQGRKIEELPPGYQDHLYFFQGKIKTIINDLTGPHPKEVWYALDHKAQHKFDIYPEYKANRKKVKLNFDPKAPVINWLLTQFCTLCDAPGYEADDVIATLISKFEDHQFTLVTSDKDLWQLLVYPNCKVYNPLNNNFVGAEDLLRVFELDQYYHIRLYKSLWGDSGDNVPNVVPRMKKALLPLIKETNGSLEHFLEVVKSREGELSTRCRELLEQNIEAVKRNYELVRLRFNLDVIRRTYP